MPTVVVQKWEESERGWGIRPDGFSIHPDEEARKRFVDAYWQKMPDEVPEEYSRPSGQPYTADISDEMAAKMDGDGHWFYNNNYPGDGGKDGWHNAKVGK